MQLVCALIYITNIGANGIGPLYAGAIYQYSRFDLSMFATAVLGFAFCFPIIFFLLPSRIPTEMTEVATTERANLAAKDSDTAVSIKQK